MNGPQHFREAERLREQARVAQIAAFDHTDAGTDPTRAWNNATYLIAAAQVHATLALAAATAYPAVRDWMGDECRDGSDWTRVTAPVGVGEAE